MSILLGEKEYFKGVGKIQFEGQESDNPLAFRFYDENRVIAGKTMKEHFKFAIAYWHSFCGSGLDPFGGPTHHYEWDKSSDVIQRAKDKADAAFEFITKIGAPYYCFHDLDVVDQDNDAVVYKKRVETMTDVLKAKQDASGVKLLWGTANLFSHERYMNGASTNPDFNVLAHAGAQLKGAIDATIALGGEGYVFWGGREGYMSLLNTNMKREREHFAQMLHTCVEYARRNGFKGKFFIEPKPSEPSKHQYDFDSATVIGFLREFGLMEHFGINLEVNHATLAGHTFAHECQVAADAGMLASLDANRGDAQNGWDTDQFPVDVYEWTEAMLILLGAGGLAGGGINFDAKRRRNSTDMEDLFYAHIGGMDTIARALIIADKITQHGEYHRLKAGRYASFDSGKGAEFEAGKLKLEDLFAIASEVQPVQISGRQEYLENLIGRFI
ncbi:xylose isomerase [Pseudarcicella hirudinis]|uniref:Xylose isomerase n=1 Tax=Pseudarcicella hirudinis TaxID=1079859 RepID=A0A1I5QZW6_9BACT|nr:xylose isomerase [Pseudarcicella hirudinis]SFP51854.1 xylose isomerase [Pseudarcicella hirudinis]